MTIKVPVRWPASQEDHLALAQALCELVGGRADVAARAFEAFAGDGGHTVPAGWSPWKGERVGADYKPEEGVTVGAFQSKTSTGMDFRKLKPLSPENVVEHLRGRQRLGVYVLDRQMACKFIAADFDDHGGSLDPAAVWGEVKRYLDTVIAQGFKAHAERSKSGRGYHVWIFFETPVPAAEARAVGKWLFAESQILREGEDFSTFDRFFPAQSALPANAKGYGNLIGLPLHGYKDYSAGKTAWVDGEGALIPDGWGHTLWILREGRNPAAIIKEFMADWKLLPEERDTADHVPRDSSTPLRPREDLTPVLARCKFLQWSSHAINQKQVREPTWFSMISNACRFEADDWIHEASKEHPGYNPTETEIKIHHARTASGPHTCKHIQEGGFRNCPAGGCKLPNGNATTSPAGLAAWADKERGGKPAKRKTSDRSVAITAADVVAQKPVVTLGPAPADIEEDERPAPWTTRNKDLPLYPETGLPWPNVPKFTIDSSGVMDGNDQYILLRPLWVDALTRNAMGAWGLSIKFFDYDWKLHNYALPAERLHEQGGILARELSGQGLPIVPGKEKWVSRFLVLQEGIITKRIMSAMRLGWYDAPGSPAVFVLPDLVLGKPKEEIIYQPDVVDHVADKIHGEGKLKDWQERIAGQVRGNPVLMFALMTGLAGPLLKLCQEQSGGFHLYGVTTGGKTTAAQVAASVWGCAADPQEGPQLTSLRKWHSTANALEITAEVFNDTLLTLDEISEVDPHELGRVIYQLAGGLSKGRAMAGGGLRSMRTWRLLFFSTGEKSVRQILAQVGQDQKGGQRVRLPDIPADDTNGGRAIIVKTHGKDAKLFVQDIKAACAEVYGLAGPLFVAWLISQADARSLSALSGELRAELKAMEKVLGHDATTNKPMDLPPEGQRVLRRFALVAVAGARAAQAGVFDWSVNEIVEAVQTVRDRWLAEQGQERSEVDRGLGHLREAIISNMDRFRWANAEGGNVRDLLGFRTEEYFLCTEAGLRELCGEFDSRTILYTLRHMELLWSEKDRLTRKAPRIASLQNTRPNLYWINTKFLGDQVGSLDDTDEDRAVAPRRGQSSLQMPVSPETPPRQPGLDDDIPF